MVSFIEIEQTHKKFKKKRNREENLLIVKHMKNVCISCLPRDILLR